MGDSLLSADIPLPKDDGLSCGLSVDSPLPLVMVEMVSGSAAGGPHPLRPNIRAGAGATGEVELAEFDRRGE